MNKSNANETIFIFNEDENSNLTLAIQILVGTFLYTLTIWTILGNIIILISISTNKQLKQNGTSNILIGNLAFSDLLLGVTVLPFSATFSTFKIWPFGQLICDMWLSIDVLCCTASIWGLLMIALDRYIATNHPIKYRLQKQNSKIGFAYVSISWLISGLISLGPLLFDKNETLTKLNENEYTCVLFRKPTFVVLSSIGSFYFPLVLMIILYAKVFIKIRSQNTFRNINLSQRRTESNHKSSQSTQLEGLSGENVSRSRAQFNAETRITKVLSIIMSCFVACWLPFFVIYIVRSYLKNPELISDSVLDVFIWLGYLNSALNPVLYLVLNNNFRESFCSIIRFNCFSNKNSINNNNNNNNIDNFKNDQENIQLSVKKNQNHC